MKYIIGNALNNGLLLHPTITKLMRHNYTTTTPIPKKKRKWLQKIPTKVIMSRRKKSCFSWERAPFLQSTLPSFHNTQNYSTLKDSIVIPKLRYNICIDFQKQNKKHQDTISSRISFVIYYVLKSYYVLSRTNKVVRMGRGSTSQITSTNKVREILSIPLSVLTATVSMLLCL